MAAVSNSPQASAIATTVGLGTAGSYSALAGQTVTNTGPSDLAAGLGVSPGTALTGFPPGLVHGAVHAGDAAAAQAQSDLTTAYISAAGQASDAGIPGELGGLTLTPGVYTAASSTQITGALTLDAQGDPDAVFLFQIGSGLTTASGSTVSLVGGAQSCHVFWQIGSSVALGTASEFVGTLMALSSISVDNGATVVGRALARNGAVTLDNTVFVEPRCASTATSSATSTATGSSGSPTSTTATTTATTGASVTATSQPTSGTTSATPLVNGSALPNEGEVEATTLVLDYSSNGVLGALADTGSPVRPLLVAGSVGAITVGLVLALFRLRRGRHI